MLKIRVMAARMQHTEPGWEDGRTHAQKHDPGDAPKQAGGHEVGKGSGWTRPHPGAPFGPDRTPLVT
jgi:hypothetical protein